MAVGEDEPQDNAIKRFRRAVMNSGLIYEVRRSHFASSDLNSQGNVMAGRKGRTWPLLAARYPVCPAGVGAWQRAISARLQCLLHVLLAGEESYLP